MSDNVVNFSEAVDRRLAAQDRYFDALARQYGYASFAELSAAADAAQDADFEAMARAQGFLSFDAFCDAQYHEAVAEMWREAGT